MKLDKHVVDMFTELTKPADDVKMEKTCYGTISVVDGTRYVKLDGSDLLVPAASTVKTSHGDRVTVLMKNHSLTVTGNLTAPATDGEGGSSGEAGTAATIEIGTVTTGEAGSSATVTNSGTTSAAVFDFVIPRGDKGDPGPQGPQGEAGTAATIKVGRVTTVEGAILASVTNSGTTSAAVFDFVIPRGEKGEKGEKGDTGTWDGTIPEHEHTVSDITDFPTSLPANGGNADTLDGKHASDFAQMRGDIADCNNAMAFGTYNIIPETLNAPTANYYHLVVEPAANGAWIKQTAVLCDPTASLINSFTRINIDGTWTGWVSSCINAVVANHQMEHVLATATDILAWASTDECLLNYNTKVRVFNSSTSPYGNRIGGSDFIYDIFKIDNHDWIRVIAYDIRSNGIYVNSKVNGTWAGWRNIADGGNADTLDGLHANEIASNPNLLINPDFRINQRGISSPTAAFGVDRWTGTYTVSDNTIVFSQAEQFMVQLIENIDSLIGREATATVYYDDGTADKGTAAISDTTYFFTTSRIHCLVYAENGIKGLEIWAAAPCNIVGVKLELGSIATPFVPPDPATELAKCQRYYQRYYANEMPYGFRVRDSYYVINMNIPIMRATPAVRYHWRFGSYDNIFEDANNAPHTAVFTTSAYTNSRAVKIDISTDASTPVGYLPADENSYCELESEI